MTALCYDPYSVSQSARMNYCAIRKTHWATSSKAVGPDVAVTDNHFLTNRAIHHRKTMSHVQRCHQSIPLYCSLLFSYCSLTLTLPLTYCSKTLNLIFILFESHLMANLDMRGAGAEREQPCARAQQQLGRTKSYRQTWISRVSVKRAVSSAWLAAGLPILYSLTIILLFWVAVSEYLLNSIIFQRQKWHSKCDSTM